MDSGGNSGSLQSSSGGDEEYDSRAAASLFLNHPPGATLSPPIFDPISNYMQMLHQNPNPSFGLNSNMAWPRPAPQRSDPNPSPDFQPPPNIGNPVAGNSHQAAPRNPKKRSRASRRAPTTVLTTDTGNFRAMVQEFTGIPSPPVPGGRFEMFGARSGGHPLSPPYLRRPFPQKVQSPPPFIDSGCNPSNSDQFNFPNPVLNYSLLLQSNPKFLFSNSPIAPSKPNPSNSFMIPPDGVDEFGLSTEHHHVTPSSLTALPNLVSGDQIGSVHHDAGSTNADSRPINGGGCSFPNGKMNLTETPSDGRRPENVGNREGTVESWK